MKAKKSMMIKYHILLDNGHGFNTPGKRSPKWHNGTQLMEYEFNRAIVLGISAALDALKIPNTIIVNEIKDISLGERVRRCNSFSSSLPVIGFSVHGNGFMTGTAHGIEVFTSVGNTKSDKIATILLKHLKERIPDQTFRTDFSDGDADKEAQFYILRKTSMPFVLSENGFMTNYDDCKQMLRQDFRKDVVMAHVNAIIEIQKKGL